VDNCRTWQDIWQPKLSLLEAKVYEGFQDFSISFTVIIQNHIFNLGQRSSQFRPRPLRPALLKIEGGVSDGGGLSAHDTSRVIEVYVKKHTSEVDHQLPKQLDGVKARIAKTDEILAL
jgi:hypothetical protein